MEQGEEEDDDEWTVQFDDGQTLRYGKRELRKLLARATSPQEKKQIDHILVSNRWRSSVTSCKSRWGPSVHRSISGKRSDHALLECTWKWRMRHVKSEPSPDFSVLQGDTKDKNGNPGPNKHAQAFQSTVTTKLKKLNYSKSDIATDIYNKLCKAIKCSSTQIFSFCLSASIFIYTLSVLHDFVAIIPVRNYPL